MGIIDRLRLKLDRANQHIADVDAAIHSFLYSHPYGVETYMDRQARKCGWILTRAEPIPDAIVLMAGDAIQNLRTTLDHLAAQLVLANGGSVAPGSTIYFPISQSAQKHASPETRRKVKGMSQSAIDAIDALHPYKGGWETLWRLHSLNNSDKHRLLLSAASAVAFHDMLPSQREELRKIYLGSHPGASAAPDFTGTSIRPQDALFPLEVGKVFFSIPESEMENNFSFRLGVAFNEPDSGVVGEPVLDTLKEFSGSVDRILGIFACFL